jgi:hypothetical protein
LNSSRSSDSNSSSVAIGVQGQGHARRVSLAERRQSPLVGRLDLGPAPPSPRSPPARLQELNLFESGERGPAVPTAFVAPATTVPTTLNNAGVGTPQLDLGSKLQNMDDTFKKTYQGLKERRKGVSRVDPPASSAAAATSTSAVRPLPHLVLAAWFLNPRFLLVRHLMWMMTTLAAILRDI